MGERDYDWIEEHCTEHYEDCGQQQGDLYED